MTSPYKVVRSDWKPCPLCHSHQTSSEVEDEAGEGTVPGTVVLYLKWRYPWYPTVALVDRACILCIWRQTLASWRGRVLGVW